MIGDRCYWHGYGTNPLTHDDSLPDLPPSTALSADPCVTALRESFLADPGAMSIRRRAATRLPRSTSPA